MLKITATLDEIDCQRMTEISKMVNCFSQFIRDQFDFEINQNDIDFDLDNNEISVPIEVI